MRGRMGLGSQSGEVLVITQGRYTIAAPPNDYSIFSRTR